MSSFLIQIRFPDLSFFTDPGCLDFRIVLQGSLPTQKLPSDALFLINEKHDDMKPRFGKLLFLKGSQILAPQLTKSAVKKLEALHLSFGPWITVYNGPAFVRWVQKGFAKQTSSPSRSPQASRRPFFSSFRRLEQLAHDDGFLG